MKFLKTLYWPRKPLLSLIALKAPGVPGRSIRVSWLAGDNPVLETAGHVDGPWSRVTSPVTVEGDHAFVTAPVEDAARLYRLRRP